MRGVPDRIERRIILPGRINEHLGTGTKIKRTDLENTALTLVTDRHDVIAGSDQFFHRGNDIRDSQACCLAGHVGRAGRAG